MSKVYKKLLNNTAIFAIGNLGTKGISLLLVPLYTLHLTQEQYGLVDLVQVTITLIIPIASLSIFEAVLRFVMDNEDHTKIFSNGFFVTTISATVIFLISTILYWIGFIPNIIYYIASIIILQLFHSFYMEFIRGIGRITLYVVSSLLMSIVLLISTYIFIILLGLGVIGYLVSFITAFFISLLFINAFVNTFRYLSLSKIEWKIVRKLLTYSIPLMPNSLMWWIINASSRYFILIFASVSSNGLYAVATKVPSVLSLFNTIFFKAWQLSAIEEYSSKNKGLVFSNVFNYYQQFLFITLSSILLILKIGFNTLIGQDFYEAWIYVPFLLVGVLFSSFSSFLGTNYIASKETSGVFRTSVIGGVTSLILNLVLIPFFGVIGASISAMVSFIAMAIIRVYDTKKYITINFELKNISINLSLIIIQICILYFNFKLALEFIILLIPFTLILVNNRMLLKRLKSLFLRRFNH